MDTILYTYQSPLTRKEVYKYWIYFNVRRKLTWILVLALTIYSMILTPKFGLSFAIRLGLGTICFYFILLFIRLNISYSKQKKKIKNRESITYNFFQEYLECIDNGTVVKIPYENLHKVIVTKTSYYLMFDSLKGIILRKECCDSGLHTFIINTIQPILQK